MTNRVAITLTDEQKARLEQIADAKEETLVATVQKAVTKFLDRNEEYRRYVQEGLDDIAETLLFEDEIRAFRQDHRHKRPWIYCYD